jgi:hypothetical protein
LWSRLRLFLFFLLRLRPRRYLGLGSRLWSWLDLGLGSRLRLRPWLHLWLRPGLDLRRRLRPYLRLWPRLDLRLRLRLWPGLGLDLRPLRLRFRPRLHPGCLGLRAHLGLYLRRRLGFFLGLEFNGSLRLRWGRAGGAAARGPLGFSYLRRPRLRR